MTNDRIPKLPPVSALPASCLSTAPPGSVAPKPTPPPTVTAPTTAPKPKPTKGNQEASFKAMIELALSDPAVIKQMDKERYELAVTAFSDTSIVPASEWMGQLKHNHKGGYETTAQNVQIMLQHDPRFAGKIALDLFSHRTVVRGPLPWNAEFPRPWTDADRAFLQIEAEKLLKIPAGSWKVDAAFTAHASKHAFHPVREYLSGLVWDGAPRLDTLFIDYLGAEDTPYTRAVTRKTFVAAVARVMRPGIKYDLMTILGGPQGGLKSTLIRIMAGDDWFTDSIKSLAGKEPMEALRGNWLVEFAEMEAFNKAEVTQIKNYLSSVRDRFRAAYGRNLEDFPRQCVFFGTTNTHDFLRDITGGRRFLPVQTDRQPRTKEVMRDLSGERDLIWAEAVIRWNAGEELYFDGELLQAAQAAQEQHRARDPWESIIADFVEQPIPHDWKQWNLDRRRMFWGGSVVGELELVPRDRVCAQEIWCEALLRPRADAQIRDSGRINAILDNLPGWERIPHPLTWPPYGSQRGHYCIR